ncbi:hypothetical protein SLEP1_g55400 [Rubroshorea leprosula]|uniref:Uncharacterized protein n=1 Tax=Rubroshorea leprosula TaxID=152421 RepID=A0AAV5MIA3_9ROSI|nr:hypothetical protein SLEP1_g55400 [Rubroshorea leprosula]
MCNHAKRIQHGNEIDVSSIGHGQRLTPTGRRTVCWCIIPTSRVTVLLVYNPHKQGHEIHIDMCRHVLAFITSPTSRVTNNMTTSETKQAKVNENHNSQSLSDHQDSHLNFNPILLSSHFFPLQPPKKKKEKKKPSHALRKLVIKLDFSLLFLSKNLIWNPEISPLQEAFGSALLFCPCPPAALVVGANSGHF